MRPVIAIAADQTNAVFADDAPDAIPVVFDLVDPTVATGRRLHDRGELGVASRRAIRSIRTFLISRSSISDSLLIPDC